MEKKELRSAFAENQVVVFSAGLGDGKSGERLTKKKSRVRLGSFKNFHVIVLRGLFQLKEGGDN